MTNDNEVRALVKRLFILTDAPPGDGAVTDRDTIEHGVAFRKSRAPKQVIRDEVLADVALAEWTARLRRTKALPRVLFGEAAWDILLDLFFHHVQGKQIRVTSACIASNVPPTTALRWIGVLEAEGLIRRVPSDLDFRVSYLTLTAAGLDAMREALVGQISVLREVAPALGIVIDV